MRWPVSPELVLELAGQRVDSVSRRGKYILLGTAGGTVIFHLGMSGNLRVVGSDAIPAKHDHVDILFDNGCILRFNDPRRFGCVLWTTDNPLEHRLLASLGPEPLSAEFHDRLLYQQSRGRTLAVKAFIMDSHIVVGVGNIYANEALFRAGIRPLRAAGNISASRYQNLSRVIREVLEEAITQGGTTLRDFVGSDGRPGYFRQQLAVYGRGGQPCQSCGQSLLEVRLGQRATVYCRGCQT
jgi:formamidopyrimidine-DNA glycosylase